LSHFAGDQEVIQRIAEEVGAQYSLDGLSIKNLILATEISIQKSDTNQIEYDHFMESL